MTGGNHSPRVDRSIFAPMPGRPNGVVNHEIGSSIAASVLESKPKPVDLGTVERVEYQRCRCLVLDGEVQIGREAASIPGPTLSQRGPTFQHHIEIEHALLVEQGESVVLCNVEQCRIAPAGSTLEVLGEVALGDPHAVGGLAAALVDHQVGKMWSMTSKRDENLDFMSRGPRWNGPPPGGAPENSASPISFCSPIDSR